MSIQRLALLVAITVTLVSVGTAYPRAYFNFFNHSLNANPIELQNGYKRGFQGILQRAVGDRIDGDASPHAFQVGVQIDVRADVPQARVGDCLPNIYGCQPTHEPWCCSSFCYKEQNWVAGYCK